MLLKKGAEANLYLKQWHGRRVIMKRRLAKAYRLSALDVAIRTQRTLREPQLIHKAKEAGVPTPTIFLIDVANSTIIMEYVEGTTIKKALNEMSQSKRQDLCQLVGKLIGRLHNHSVIHGDLTTSNMILTAAGRVYFVDFGLGEQCDELEVRGVDLHLMRRALQSTHYKYAKDCFDAVFKGYAETVGKDNAKNVQEKISEIERRGRYIAEREEEEEE